MPRFVIGLEHDGHRLRNEIMGYIQESRQPNDQEHLEAIYAEIISQIVHAFHEDFQTYMLNIMSVPNFMTINFTEDEVDFNLIRRFGDQVRSFAVRVWNAFYPKLFETRSTNRDHAFIFVMESVTADYLVLNAYPSEQGVPTNNHRGVYDNPAF